MLHFLTPIALQCLKSVFPKLAEVHEPPEGSIAARDKRRAEPAFPASPPPQMSHGYLLAPHRVHKLCKNLGGLLKMFRMTGRVLREFCSQVYLLHVILNRIWIQQFLKLIKLKPTCANYCHTVPNVFCAESEGAHSVNAENLGTICFQTPHICNFIPRHPLRLLLNPPGYRTLGPYTIL